MTDLTHFIDIAEQTRAGLPQPFRDLARDVLIEVVDWPDPDMLAEMQIDDPLELTGLYDGIPLTEKSLADPSPAPDRVWLFREPILDEWRDRGDVALNDLIAHVLIHELAHYFGWSDDDIAQVDRWWE